MVLINTRGFSDNIFPGAFRCATAISGLKVAVAIIPYLVIVFSRIIKHY